MTRKVTVFGSHWNNAGSTIAVKKPVTFAPIENKQVFYADARDIREWLRNEIPSGTYRALAIRIMRDMADDILMGNEPTRQVLHDMANMLSRMS